MANTIQHERRQFGEDIPTREEWAIRHVVRLDALEDSIRGSVIRVILDEGRIERAGVDEQW